MHNFIRHITELKNPGESTQSSAKIIGEKLKEAVQKDLSFYLFSPDETTSNKLDAIYESTTRAWLSKQEDWDLPSSESGQIIELLSENALFSCLVGHILSGKKGMMTSYEAFLNIIISQIAQYVKFLNQSDAVSWRKPVPALNLLSTSTCWRQDHNGYSHQSPALISHLLNTPNQKSNCLFPVDSISAETVFDYMQSSQNVVNLTTFNKTDEPIWIDSNHAKFQLQHGASIFGFASDDDFADNGYVFTAAGDISTKESLYAIKILRQDLPSLKIRFVGILSLSHGQIGTVKNPMPQSIFDDYFGKNSTIIANFHGYPDDLGHILANYTQKSRLFLHGYREYGSTTTPFEMLSLNSASRYHLALDVAHKENRPDLVEKYQNILAANRSHATSTSLDLPEIANFNYGN